MKRTRSDLRVVIETIRGRPSLLAAYLDATNRFDWQALRKPVPIGKLATVANPKVGDASSGDQSTQVENSSSTRGVVPASNLFLY